MVQGPWQGEKRQVILLPALLTLSVDRELMSSVLLLLPR